MKKGGTFGDHTKTGKTFEEATDLATFIEHHYDLQPLSSNLYKPKELMRSFDVFDRETGKHIGMVTRKAQFHKVIKEFYNIDFEARDVPKWEPDDVYINEDSNTFFIIEKKFQQTSGSTDEKILAFAEKAEQYRYAMEGIPIEYRPHLIFVGMFNEEYWLNNKNSHKNYECNLNWIMRKGIWTIFDEYTFEMFGLK